MPAAAAPASGFLQAGVLQDVGVAAAALQQAPSSFMQKGDNMEFENCMRFLLEHGFAVNHTGTAAFARCMVYALRHPGSPVTYKCVVQPAGVLHHRSNSCFERSMRYALISQLSILNHDEIERLYGLRAVRTGRISITVALQRLLMAYTADRLPTTTRDDVDAESSLHGD